MNILICDDMPKEANKLKRLLAAQGIATSVFHHGRDALRYIEDGGFADVCILDIIMPEMTGIELAGRLRRTGWDGPIVFLSTSKEFGPETYQVNAFDYLLKPPTQESVMAMLQKLDEAEKNSDIKSIQLKTGRTVRSVLLRDISYVEAMQHNVIYHLTDGNEVEVYATFTDAVKEISADSRFIRCHRSHLVNMDEITAITGNEITLRDKKVLSISRPYADVKRRYYDRGLTKQSV